jgi:hypothetical protein
MSECFKDHFADMQVYGEYFLKLVATLVVTAYHTYA